MAISNGRNAVAHAATWLSAVSACAACGLLSFLSLFLPPLLSDSFVSLLRRLAMAAACLQPLRRGLRKGAQAFFGAWPRFHHAVHAVTSGRNLFNRLVWHAVIGACCLFDDYCMCSGCMRNCWRKECADPSLPHALWAWVVRNGRKACRPMQMPLWIAEASWVEAQQKGGKGAGEIAQA